MDLTMNKNILTIFLIIIISILIWNCNNNDENKSNKQNFEQEKISVNIGQKDRELKFSFEKINPLKEKRVWKKIQMVSKFKIGGIDNGIFLYPSRVKIDEDENIYVLDILDCSVKKFDKMGKFIKKYGKKGKGPGEVTHAFDFDVLNNGEIVIIDPNGNKFVVFDENKVDEFKFSLSPTSVSFVSKNEVAILQIMDPITQSPIRKVNYKTDVLTDYQNILDKESFSGKDFGMLPFLLGFLQRYNSNDIVYISSIMGYVVLFNKDSEIYKAFKLIDDEYESSLTKKERKINGKLLTYFPRREEYIYESTNIFGNDLFIFCNPIRFNPVKYVIDVYSLTKNNYKYSFLLDDIGNIHSVSLTNNKMYVVRENTEVEVFDYKIIDN